MGFEKFRLTPKVTKLLDLGIMTVILSVSYHFFEALLSKSELDQLLLVEQDLYQSIAKFNPWDFISTLWDEIPDHEFGWLGLYGKYLSAIIRIPAAFVAILDHTYLPTAIMLMLCWLLLTGFFYYHVFNKRVWHPPALLLPPLMAVGLTSLFCWIVQLLMLGSLYTFGWFLKTAMLFASLPIGYSLVLRHVEHGLVDRLLHWCRLSRWQEPQHKQTEKANE
jgi:hypothetical protein